MATDAHSNIIMLSLLMAHVHTIRVHRCECISNLLYLLADRDYFRVRVLLADEGIIWIEYFQLTECTIH